MAPKFHFQTLTLAIVCALEFNCPLHAEDAGSSDVHSTDDASDIRDATDVGDASDTGDSAQSSKGMATVNVSATAATDVGTINEQR